MNACLVIEISIDLAYGCASVGSAHSDIVIGCRHPCDTINEAHVWSNTYN